MQRAEDRGAARAPNIESAGMGALHWLCAAAVFAAGIAYLYWPLIEHGHVSGDTNDAEIQIAILQNWSNCLSGYGRCLSPNYFHPLTGTLGYNDGYLIAGALFHVFRLLGFDPFVAYDLAYIPIRLVGFVAVIALGVQCLKLPPWAAILAAWLSLISINVFNQVVHTQLIYAAFVPLGVLLFLQILDLLVRLDAPVPASAAAVLWRILALGILCAAWAVTAFYSFFFFALFAILMLIASAVFKPRQVWHALRNLIHQRAVAAATLASAIAILAPVWIVYGGPLRESGGQHWHTALNPRLADLFNVGPNNLIWSAFLSGPYRALTGEPMASSELAIGFPLLFLLCLVLSLAYLGQLAIRLRTSEIPIYGDPRGIAIVLGIASFLSLLLVLRVGDAAPLWSLIWKTVPGARAIRVPARFYLFATPMLCLIVAYGVAQWQLRHKANVRRSVIALVLLAGALTIEQYNTRPPVLEATRAELNYFDSIPPPPAGCKAFFVSVPRRGPYGDTVSDVYYNHSVDAMIVAAFKRIPTVNGMASVVPRNWNLDSPFKADYPARVEQYARRHGILDGLCSLDLKTKRWAAEVF